MRANYGSACLRSLPKEKGPVSWTFRAFLYHMKKYEVAKQTNKKRYRVYFDFALASGHVLE